MSLHWLVEVRHQYENTLSNQFSLRSVDSFALWFVELFNYVINVKGLLEHFLSGVKFIEMGVTAAMLLFNI